MTESLSSQTQPFPNREEIDSLLSKGWIPRIFDSFIDAIEVGVYVLDRSGVVRQVNKFITEHYGWQPQELLGKNIFELMPDLTETVVEEKFKQVVHERLVTVMTSLERIDRDGRFVVYNLTGLPIIEGDDVIGVLAVMNDITEKRALESQVAEAEEYLESLIDNANDIIYTLDRKGQITFLNKMGQEITGYSITPSGDAPYTNYIIKKDVPKNQKYFKEALKGHPQRFSTSIVAIDARIVDILINLTPIHKGDEVVGVLGIARDVTERNNMQAQLIQASKMAAIGELAAGVAHEINNPVGIISGAAEQLQFLLDHIGGQNRDVPENFLKHVEVIREQADRCRRITQGLLNFARKTDIRKTEVDIAGLIKETVALLENRTIKENKKAVTHISEGLPTIMADPHLLEQVFVNLVNNALDALGDGGTVTIKARSVEGRILLSFTDDGGGIDEDSLKKIFDPFFTTKPPGKGTGLGLSICLGIIEQMGGTLSVESKLGAGTTFMVRLLIE